MNRRQLDGAVFDLDGVVTRTARVHAASWKDLFDEFLQARAEERGEPFVPFSIEEDYRMHVDGRPRIEGVQAFLASRGIALPKGEDTDPAGETTAWALGNRKNEIFQTLVASHGVEIMADTVTFIEQLIREGVRVGVASSSRNCSLILKVAGLADLFSAQVDGVESKRLSLDGKPSPDIFLEAARRLGVAPSNTLVVEDALSGVQAGRAGGFGLVIGLGAEPKRLALREHGADWVVERFDESSLETARDWFLHAEHRRPSAIAAWDGIRRRMHGRKAALFLDYDGTLTPIAARPELAVLPDDRRRVLESVAAEIPTAVISGRGREDVEALVKIDSLAYAGSHGFDIVGPQGASVDYEVAPWIEPKMGRIADQLTEALAPIDGCILEPKGFSVAVHYRLVAEEHLSDVERVVNDIVGQDERLRKATGKKVFEIRPALDWDKGKALLVLLEALKLDASNVLPIYIGDDVTDEDAFAVLQEDGIGILVSPSPKPTAAEFVVQDPWEVYVVLERLSMSQEGQRA